MSARNGFLILLVLIFAVAAWIAIGGLVLSLRSFFASFMFLWYWGAVQKADFNCFVPTVIGALVGVALAWELHFLAKFGIDGIILSVIILCAAIFVEIVRWVPIALNSAAMLFLTVLAAPALTASVNFIEVSEAVVMGAVFFAGVVYAAKRLAVVVVKP